MMTEPDKATLDEGLEEEVAATTRAIARNPGERKSYIWCSKTEILMDNSLRAKTTGTVIAIFGWFAFIVLFLAFSPVSMNFWQRLAVFVASGAIVICIIAVLWIRWTMK